MHIRGIVFAAVFIYAAFFCAAFSISDTIIMKSGKKTEGVIIEYSEEQYVFKAAGKKYYLPEKMVESINWSATRSQLDSAFEGEEPLDFLQAHSKNLWLFIEPVAGCLLVLDNGNSGSISGAELYAGIAYGMQQKAGRGTGHDGSVRGFEYILPAKYSLNLTFGTLAGSIAYREPGASGDSTAALSSSTVMLMLNGMYRHQLPLPSAYFYWGLGLGATMNFDSLDSYPMGWKEYRDYPDFMKTPGLVDAVKYSGMYLGEAVRTDLGLQVEVNDMLFINGGAGFQWRTKQRYDDPERLGSEFGLIDPRACLIIGGWYIETSVRFLF